MDTLLSPLSHDHAAFDFSGLAPSPMPETVAAGLGSIPDSTPDGFDLWPVLRRLLPWITAQAAAAIGLGTCLAQAMPPVAPKAVPTADLTFALRLGEAYEAAGPVPSAIRDGFHLRFATND